MDGAYQKSIPSDKYQIKPVVREILGFVEKHLPGLSEDEYGDLRLVFSELLYNAVIHGNHEDLRKKVAVGVEIKRDTVFASIMDEGRGFDIRHDLSRVLHCKDCQNLDESGRGIPLVYSLTDALDFNDRGNQIRFHKKVGVHG